jgi:hypothetical protein
MSRRKSEDKGRLPPFVPVFISTMETPAWKALSMGARILYLQLKRHHFSGIKNNNGKIYLSQRNATEEMGSGNRDSVRRWFAELEHFGFIVKTSAGSLGVDGKGKAPQWRLTELPAPTNDQPLATRDYEKWDGRPFNGNQFWRGRGLKPQKQNPGRETTSTVDAKQRSPTDAKQRPLHGVAGRDTTSISEGEGGRETTSISRVTTPMPLEGGSRSAPSQGAVASEPPDWGAVGYPPASPSREEVIAALERRAEERGRSRRPTPCHYASQPRDQAIADGSR